MILTYCYLFKVVKLSSRWWDWGCLWYQKVTLFFTWRSAIFETRLGKGMLVFRIKQLQVCFLEDEAHHGNTILVTKLVWGVIAVSSELLSRKTRSDPRFCRGRRRRLLGERTSSYQWARRFPNDEVAVQKYASQRFLNAFLWFLVSCLARYVACGLRDSSISSARWRRLAVVTETAAVTETVVWARRLLTITVGLTFHFSLSDSIDVC